MNHPQTQQHLQYPLSHAETQRTGDQLCDSLMQTERNEQVPIVLSLTFLGWDTVRRNICLCFLFTLTNTLDMHLSLLPQFSTMFTLCDWTTLLFDLEQRSIGVTTRGRPVALYTSFAICIVIQIHNSASNRVMESDLSIPCIFLFLEENLETMTSARGTSVKRFRLRLKEKLTIMKLSRYPPDKSVIKTVRETAACVCY